MVIAVNIPGTRGNPIRDDSVCEMKKENKDMLVIVRLENLTQR